MMEVMCCASPDGERICASRPLVFDGMTRPTTISPADFAELPRREDGSPRLRKSGNQGSISDSEREVGRRGFWQVLSSCRGRSIVQRGVADAEDVGGFAGSEEFLHEG